MAESEEIEQTTGAEDVEATQTDGGSESNGLNALLKQNPDFQSQFDTLIGKSLETARSKWEEQKKQDIKNAEKRAKMTAVEKAEADAEATKAEYQKKIRDLEIKNTTDRLTSKSIPKEAVDLIYHPEDSTPEALEQSLTEIIKTVKEQTEKDVRKELSKGKLQHTSETNTDTTHPVKGSYAYYKSLED